MSLPSNAELREFLRSVAVAEEGRKVVELPSAALSVAVEKKLALCVFSTRESCLVVVTHAGMVFLAEPAPPPLASRRTTTFWCGHCPTIVSIQSTVSKGDPRALANPPKTPSCPCCGEWMHDHDVLVRESEAPVDDPSWAAFEGWLKYEPVAGEYVSAPTKRRRS